jgi:hypothetical protein
MTHTHNTDAYKGLKYDLEIEMHTKIVHLEWKNALRGCPEVFW